jgi:hypothetical protein
MTYICSRSWSTPRCRRRPRKPLRSCSRSVPAVVRKRVKSTGAEYTTQSHIRHNGDRFFPVRVRGHSFSALYWSARELRHLTGFVVGVECSIEEPLPGE